MNELAPLLQTPRLSLRRITIADAPFLLGLLNEPSFIRNIGDRGLRTHDDAQHYVREGPLASYQRHGFGLYLVELRQLGTPIGICGLLKREEPRRRRPRLCAHAGILLAGLRAGSSEGGDGIRTLRARIATAGGHRGARQ